MNKREELIRISGIVVGELVANSYTNYNTQEIAEKAMEVAIAISNRIDVEMTRHEKKYK